VATRLYTITHTPQVPHVAYPKLFITRCF